LYRVRLLEGETLPNSNVLFPVVFENEASTPLENRGCDNQGKRQRHGIRLPFFITSIETGTVRNHSHKFEVCVLNSRRNIESILRTHQRLRDFR
jgi:hypothetical protein